MKDKFFLDTNLLVYSFDPADQAKRKRALELIEEGVLSRRGVISYQVVQEFLNLAFRKFTRPLSEGDARDYYRKILKPLCAVHSSSKLFARALTVHEDTQYHWYDSLIVAAALESDCSVLYTEDLGHKHKVESLTIVNPFK